MHVYAGADLPEAVAASLGAQPSPPHDELLRRAAHQPVVVVVVDANEPAAAALLAGGATMLAAPAPPGAGLLAAVTVMDRLRSPGGCPWDAAQNHATLRQYLVEEAFELLEAIDDGDRAMLREELGDVLLQVLFHARIAAEDPADPFTVDEVADELVTKLVGRHPHVFAGGDPAVWDAASQERRWEELKRLEKRRESSVDGVALGQPAIALAAKLTQRATRAGLPADLLPDPDSAASHSEPGTTLFGLVARTKLAGHEPEGELRATARRFADNVREAEGRARAAGVDPTQMDAAAWRKFWPHGCE